ncbi:MAG: GGDEF domain-containing protein [Gammaproteobacteria bacterium]|nr:GGDEF domain-containing protein [Gammaproteobacteria bacterium]
MSTTQLRNINPLPLSLLDAPPRATPGFGLSHLVQQLSHQLQASLDIDEVLGQFSREIKAFVAHDHLGYRNDHKDCGFSIGKSGRCRINYKLSIKNEGLGQLVLTRKSKFTKTETEAVERLAAALLYPLRNALRYREAVQAAQKDALTGIGNRAALNESLRREIELAQRHKRTLGMIIFDIDHFKNINDTYGHNTGDCLLKALTHTAEETIRNSDQVFRYGGEEFVVLLPETGIDGVKQLAERIRSNVEALECICEGHHIKMTASFGVAILQADETDESFFVRTDKALYQAKNAGRNCTRVSEPTDRTKASA